MAEQKVVRTLSMDEHDTLEIQWFHDKQLVYIGRYMCPPKNVQQAWIEQIKGISYD